MVDAVVRHCRSITGIEPGSEVNGQSTIFYADDGLLTDTDPARLQDYLNLITSAFESIGLKMNARKTKFMVALGQTSSGRISSRAYKRLHTGQGPSNKEHTLAKVQCLKCGREVARRVLDRHQKSKICIEALSQYVPPTPIHNRVAREQPGSTPRGLPNIYSISIPTGSVTNIHCPVPMCPYNNHDQNALTCRDIL